MSPISNPEKNFPDRVPPFADSTQDDRSESRADQYSEVYLAHALLQSIALQINPKEIPVVSAESHELLEALLAFQDHCCQQVLLSESRGVSPAIWIGIIRLLREVDELYALLRGQSYPSVSKLLSAVSQYATILKRFHRDSRQEEQMRELTLMVAHYHTQLVILEREIDNFRAIQVSLFTDSDAAISAFSALRIRVQKVISGMKHLGVFIINTNILSVSERVFQSIDALGRKFHPENSWYEAVNSDLSVLQHAIHDLQDQMAILLDTGYFVEEGDWDTPTVV